MGGGYREVSKHLTRKGTEPWEILYFKAYKSRLPVIEQALETAALMLESDKSRGYRLEMICADFLAGVSLEAANRHVFCTEPHSNRPVCSGTKKHKWQISRNLGESVVQICILGLAIRSRSSVCASVPQHALPAEEHTVFFAWNATTRFVRRSLRFERG
jgi:hypothetical protein